LELQSSEASSARRYHPLGCSSNATLDDFKKRPEHLFNAHDLAAARIVGSRAALHRTLRAGRFPKPLRLPSGRMAWKGRTITDWLDELERRTAGDPPAVAA
jgi:predicted DNA-binding transcriptional regulator AlpA